MMPLCRELMSAANLNVFHPSRLLQNRALRQHLGALAVVVRDYDEAIEWYTQKLGLQPIENTDLGQGKRWVLLAPKGSMETRLLLAKASGANQLACIGNQTGGRVF